MHMKLGSIVYVALSAGLVVTSLGCSSNSGGPPSSTKLNFGKDCTTGDDCASGVCLNFNAIPNPNSSSGYMAVQYGGYCTTSCAGGCPTNYTCGTAPDGTQECMETCFKPDESLSDRYGCKNSVPVACNLADQTYCGDCMCPSALRCEPGVGCQERRELNGPCTSDADCKSNNCSSYLGVCRVPVWAACTADNCDLCTTDSSGTVFCTKECYLDSQCNGGSCLGSNNYYTCRRPCSSCASSDCQFTEGTTYNPSIYYCGCSGCTVASAPRPLGVICNGNGQCASKLCYETNDLKQSDYGTSYLQTVSSVCTQACTSDADCSAGGLVCAQVPCAGVATTLCGPLCVHPCDADGTCATHGGTCRGLSSPSGGNINVCDIRRDNGSYCASNDICLSGRCTNNTCINAGGSSNGSSCVAPTDCASANCINKVCTGSALIGDACSVAADCSVGTCCTGTSKCATTC
jgi:hypothetical protein